MQNIIFFATLIVVLALTFSSIAKMVRARFPDPTDLAIVSTVYYAVPLATAGYLSWNGRNLIFLHAAAADRELAFISLLYAALAIAMLYLGRWLGALRAAPVLTIAFYIGPASMIREWVSYAAVCLSIVLGIVSFGLDNFLAGYATESLTDNAEGGIALVYFAVGVVGLIFSHALIRKNIVGGSVLHPPALIALLFVVFVLIARAKRLEVVTAMLPLSVVLLAGRTKLGLSLKQVTIAVIGLLALSIGAAIRVGDRIEPFTIFFYIFSEGLYAGHSLPGIIGAIDGLQLDYEYGVRFLNSLLGFIPRFIWEGKNEFVYGANEWILRYAPLGATSMLAEVALQGGAVAIAVVYTCFGYVFERVRKFEPYWAAGQTSGLLPFRFVVYLIIIAIFIPHFRDGIIPAMKLSLQAIAFSALLFKITPVAAVGRPRSNDQVHGKL